MESLSDTVPREAKFLVSYDLKFIQSPVPAMSNPHTLLYRKDKAFPCKLAREAEPNRNLAHLADPMESQLGYSTSLFRMVFELPYILDILCKTRSKSLLWRNRMIFSAALGKRLLNKLPTMGFALDQLIDSLSSVFIGFSLVPRHMPVYRDLVFA